MRGSISRGTVAERVGRQRVGRPEGAAVAWWARLRGVLPARRGRRGAGSRSPAASDGPTKADVQAALAHLKDFVATRRGVEMYVEPRTSVTPTTVVLVATSGEWTRRRVSDPNAGWKLARELGVPVYDVQQVGYPPRMREWTAQQRRSEKG